MDADLWIKIIPLFTTVAFSASTLWLGLRQYRDGNKNARREEYKFAKLFFEELHAQPAMHPFARKKGFQAIGRNGDLPPGVIEHLMGFQDPVMALNDYESSRSYLKHTEELGKRQLGFESKLLLSTEQRRRVMSGIYISGAAIFYLVAFSPWFLLTLKIIPVPVAVNALIILSPIGIAVTVVSVRKFIQLRRAMRLVTTQNREADDQDANMDEKD